MNKTIQELTEKLLELSGVSASNDVVTESEGEEPQRYLVIKAK